MERETEFRGIHKHVIKDNKHLDGKWIYGYLCNSDYINSPDLQGEFLVDKNTVGQYTGMHDKNGKKIYEGDKCYVGRPCVSAEGYITFLQGCFIFEEFKTGNILRLCDLELNGYEIKVIGTIHDNQTLLSQQSTGTE